VPLLSAGCGRLSPRPLSQTGLPSGGGFLA
jgi:hypothetical protein